MSRKPKQALTEAETQGALSELVGVMTENFMSPPKAVAPSAASLLMTRGIASSASRASYILHRLTEVGAITPIEGSRAYHINRKTVVVGRTPIMPEATKLSYEETIRRLAKDRDAIQKQLDAASAKHTLELNEVKNLLVGANSLNERLQNDLEIAHGELSKLSGEVDEPSKDIRAIMERTLGE